MLDYQVKHQNVWRLLLVAQGRSGTYRYGLVYDRAELTTLPEGIRKLYVAQLRLIVSESTDVFLLTIEDVEENENLVYIPI